METNSTKESGDLSNQNVAGSSRVARNAKPNNRKLAALYRSGSNSWDTKNIRNRAVSKVGGTGRVIRPRRGFQKVPMLESFQAVRIEPLSFFLENAAMTPSSEENLVLASVFSRPSSRK